MQGSNMQGRQGNGAGKINSSIYFDRNAIKVLANAITWLPLVLLASEEVSQEGCTHVG